VENEIPLALLKKYPELETVGVALTQRRLGQSVTAACIKCGQVLVVEEVEATGTLIVRCPDDHTFFRARRGNPRGM
jgi:hypothetical protein